MIGVSEATQLVVEQSARTAPLLRFLSVGHTLSNSPFHTGPSYRSKGCLSIFPINMQTSALFISFLLLVALILPAVEAGRVQVQSKIKCQNYHSKCGSNTKICRHKVNLILLILFTVLFKTYRLMMVHLCPISCSLCNEHISLKAQCQDKLATCKEELCHHKDYKKMAYKMCRATCKRC